jgi:N-acetylglucosamine kinase-like BadF-type ATPase
MLFETIFERLCPGIPTVLDNDAVNALIAGTGRRYGVVVISGTGSIAFGLGAQGQRARSAGWGHLIDQGSGHTIARETLVAIARAHDATGPETKLTGRILKVLGLSSPVDLIAWIHDPNRRFDEIAALAAETVALAAEDEDPVATGIVCRAADALAEQAVTVARRVGFGSEPFPVVVSGTLLVLSDLLRELFAISLQTRLPHAVTLIAEHDATTGAAIMALEALGVSIPPSPLPLPAQADRRATERRNPLTLNFHRRPTLDLVTLMNLEDQRVPKVIAAELPRIAALVEAAAERFTMGGRIFFVGAGTSGRLAVFDAAECRPTFSTSPDQISGVIAGGPEALTHSVEGAEDSEGQGRRLSLAWIPAHGCRHRPCGQRHHTLCLGCAA